MNFKKIYNFQRFSNVQKDFLLLSWLVTAHRINLELYFVHRSVYKILLIFDVTLDESSSDHVGVSHNRCLLTQVHIRDSTQAKRSRVTTKVSQRFSSLKDFFNIFYQKRMQVEATRKRLSPLKRQGASNADAMTFIVYQFVRFKLH